MSPNPLDTLRQIWPEWQIDESSLKSGSYGKVYRAVRMDYTLESQSAIKIVSVPADPAELDSLRSEGLDMTGSRTYLQKVVDNFVREIQTMEALKGVQNIVSIEDHKVVERSGEIGWDIFIRMEWLTPFSAYTCDRELTEAEAAGLGRDICTALETCGKRDIIHRDIKPGNIFVNSFGDFKLGDFGIARTLEHASTLTMAGTPMYIAPEVYNGQRYDARADIYSLGLVLYQLMNGGRMPCIEPGMQFLTPEAKTKAFSRRIRGEALPAPSGASPAMAALICRACAYAPEDRFPSAAEMKNALLAITAPQSPAQNTGPLSFTGNPCKEESHTDSQAPAGENPDKGDDEFYTDDIIRHISRRAKEKRKLPLAIAVLLLALVIILTELFAVPRFAGGIHADALEAGMAAESSWEGES